MAELGKMSRDKGGEANGLPNPTKGKNGTVLMARDSYNDFDMSLEGNPESVQEGRFHTFAHEIGNILAYKATKTKTTKGNYDAFGDPNGIVGGTGYSDRDTGANIEKCVFGSVTF